MFLQDKLGRRELFRIGALSVLGGLISPRGASAKPAGAKPRNCIFMLLQGGPSHHDLWDPKPLTAEDVRGPFGDIATAVPGIRFGALLKGTAKVADRLCIVRSMTHKFTNHIAGTYITLTGSTNTVDEDRSAEGDDFPGPGAVLNYLQQEKSSLPRSVSLPNWLTIPVASDRMPGQYGGFLGSVYDPFLIEGDPSAAGYQPLTLSMPEGLSADRLRDRLSLVRQLDGAARLLERELNDRYDHLRQSAYEMVVDGRLQRALDLSRETPATRDRYGRTKIGQSLLLARRLVEAGVQFVAYNAYNQRWDTHNKLQKTYEEIVPPMDAAYSALIEDLAARNLLEDTMVVNTGEFGRTPRVNEKGGRDHWPNVYSTVLAGGGFRGGQVHGESDGLGAEVLSQAVSPADILATLYRQMGVSPTTSLRDRLNRPVPLSDGRVLEELLG
jgi:hypothetical protein